MDRILLIDKPSGVSSAAVLNLIKRKLSLKKIGHAGTLDPFASGLLVVLTGRCTKLAFVPEAADKEYQGEITFGVATDTEDITGQITEKSEIVPTNEEVAKAALKLTGEISQMPPRFSALKIDGKRAYVLARSGADFELKPRFVTVSEFNLWQVSERLWGFRAMVSKGTYIRSLARDLGRLAGSCAVLSSLRQHH